MYYDVNCGKVGTIMYDMVPGQNRRGGQGPAADCYVSNKKIVAAAKFLRR